MPRKSTKDAIVTAADDLFYRQGFESTSFADVSGSVGISRGNFYHHFKSKDEILDAVIERRIEDREILLEKWETDGTSPAQRVKCFIRILCVNEAKIRKYGCPIGTLSTELSKLKHEATGDARRLFDLFRTWLCRQFEAMGHAPAIADTHAMHILARTQGVATLANAYPEEDFLEVEAEQMCAWVDTITAAPP